MASDRDVLQSRERDIMASSRQILGISFFNGAVDEALTAMDRRGGFLIAPSGTCFARLREDEMYRRAVVAADLAIPDSGFMVLLWRLFRREKIARISGLKYLKRLLRKLRRKGAREILFIIPSERARQKLFQWSRSEAFPVLSANGYVAPRYGLQIEDRNLLLLLEQNRPSQIVIGIGSGAQEKLGYYLRENLPYRPAIHCIGGALGFVTGEQIRIPNWADRFYLGWLLRLISQPRRFVPRLIRGFELPWLMWKYGHKLPPMEKTT